MLIGDILTAARDLIPDPAQTLPTPSFTASVVSAAGSTLPAGTYYVKVSQRNQWGETLPAAESSQLTVAANQGIQITSAPPPGATTIRAYLTLVGGASGSEQQFVESTTSPFTISTPPTLAGIPPSRATAWLPDTDGKRISCGALYRWLNFALARASRMAGGLQDYSGVGSVDGVPLYQVTGEWAKVDVIWYDGFGMTLGNQRDFFRRNAITSSVLASAAVSVRDSRVIIEVFYQPVRTAGLTTLSSAMASTDIVANCSSLSGFQSFGPPMLVQIGTEIMAFSAISGTQLTGLLRGIGGTVAQAWPIGTSVQELNIWILGKRLHTTQYQPGNSVVTLPVPNDWGWALQEYLLGRARLGEQDDDKGDKYLQRFEQAITQWLRSNRQLMGPVQAGGQRSTDVVPGFGTELGGVILS